MTIYKPTKKTTEKKLKKVFGRTVSDEFKK